MKFNHRDLRFELTNGDVCVCILEDGCNWNQTGIALGIYYDGHFYDQMIKEENELPHESWCLCYDDTKLSSVAEYSFTGYNVEDLNSPVLD